MGGSLVTKFVNPIKTLCSWTPHQRGVCQSLFSETKPHVGTAAAGILRKANSAVRQKVSRLDPSDCAFYQMAELLSLFLSDGSAQVLNVHQALPDKYHLGNLRNPGYPRVADKLRIQSQQSLRLFRISTRRCFPFQQAALAIEFPYGVDISNEVVAAGNLPSEFDLKVALRLADPDTIILAEPGQECDSLPEHAIPGVSVGVMQALGLTRGPLGEQHCSRIFPAKESTQSLFEGTTEQHRGAGVFLLPAIEVAMPITPRAREVLADLGVAVGHIRRPVGCPGLQGKVLPNDWRVRIRRVGTKKHR